MVHLFATLGPACCDVETLRAMFSEGMDGARINLSHGRLTDRRAWLSALFDAAAAEGVHTKLIIDMQGPEVRIGALEHPFTLTNGAPVRLGEGGVPAPEAALSLVANGDVLLLDDGRIRLRALDASKNTVLCRVETGGTLLSCKSLAIEGKEIVLPALTDTDRENLSCAASLGVTGVMQPFVRGRGDLSALSDALREADFPHARVYAKVENRTGLQHLPELIQGADEVVIARGDLGNAVPLCALPGVQKDIAGACNAAGKPFMVATELLYTMTERGVPTRAEVSDVFNAVLDGASSLIVTGETAVGRYPARVIETLRRTAFAAERYRAANRFAQ